MTTPAQSPPAVDGRPGGVSPGDSSFACPWCGQLHTRVPLRPGDSSRCVRCDSPLGTGRASNWIVTLAWVVTGLILWVPANLLPIVSVSQLGNSHQSLVITGAFGVWHEGMPFLAVLVVLCAILAPLLLLLALAAILVPIALGRPSPRLRFVLRWLRRFELWSLPEVFLLAVLVALIKLGDLVHYAAEPGLACCVGMTLALLVAWRRFDLDAAAAALVAGKSEGGVT